MLPADIIFESKDYLIANKPSGQLVLPSKDRSESNLHSVLENEKSCRLHILTRLDRPVSGLCLFSKNAQFTKTYLLQQEKNSVSKTYLALVEGRLKLENAEIVHWGWHNKRNHKMTALAEEAKHAVSMKAIFNTILFLDRYTLMEIEIHRGRFHQLRCQCAALGHPIKGDVKYGARRANTNRQIHLHSHKIRFQSPQAKVLEYQAELPKNDDLWALIADKLNKLDG